MARQLDVAAMQRGNLLKRYMRAMFVARGNPLEAAHFAHGQNDIAAMTIFRGITEAVDSTQAASAMQPVGVDFAEVLRPATIIGRLQGVRRVPFQTRVVNMTGAAAAWAGEGAPMPISSAELSSDEVMLPRAKCTGIVVQTEEIARSPTAQDFLVSDITGAVAQALDETLIDPANTGGDEKPASITHDAPSFESTGATLAEIDADLALLISTLADTGSTLERAHWVMRPGTALYLSRLRGTGGALAHPTVTVRGGMLLGLPVIVSGNVPIAAGSPDTTSITLIDADGILLADDNEAAFEIARHASIQMDDAPTGGAQQLVSMWQLGLSALRVQRWINWRPRRANIAAVLTGVAY